MRRIACSICLAMILVVGATGEVAAENLKGRWSVGGGLSWLSVKDDIRSNASFILFDQPGPDGIPDTGDEAILFFDPRPDDTVGRETTVDEGIAFNVSFSYGILDWLSIQFDTGRYSADIVQFDTYTEQTFFVADQLGFFTLNTTEDFEQSQPINAGTLTQIPLSLTAMFRFRKDSPLNPYIGVGGGYVLYDAKESTAVDGLNDLLSNVVMRTEGVYDFPAFLTCQTECEFGSISVQVKDSAEWHVAAGAEYYFNSKLSMYFDARYMFVSDPLRIDVDGFDQLTFGFESPNDQLLFCTDPTFDSHPFPPDFDREADGQMPNNGILPDDPSDDFQGCRPGTPGTRLVDTLLVQGGDIDLSYFTVGVGVRFSF